MNTFLGILLAIFLFGVMIFVHEFGHYFTARLCKVTVEEFAIGMGPVLFTRVSKKTGIRYSVRLLPIGGFTKMLGEDEAVEKKDENGEPIPDPGALTSKKPWQRLIVLFAGSFMNILTGVIAIFILVSLLSGYGNTTVFGFYKDGGPENVVYEVNEESPSYQAGIRKGDRVLKINSHAIVDYTDLLNTVALEGTEPVDITVERGGQELVFSGVRLPVEETEGVKVGTLDFATEWVKFSFSQRLSQTASRSVATVKVIYNSLVKLITGKLGTNAVSGPVGTVSTIGQAVSSEETKGYRFEYVLYLFSFISINLGVMNLLPLPALDGGRIIFVLIEIVIRRPVNRRYEGLIHFVGMAILLLLMAVITVLDVMKFFK